MANLQSVEEGSVCGQHTVGCREMSEIKRARSDFLDQGSVLATIPPGDPAAAGSQSSLFSLRAGRATAEAAVKATAQV